MKRVDVSSYMKAMRFYCSNQDKTLLEQLRAGSCKLQGAMVPFYVATLPSGAPHFFISDGLQDYLSLECLDDQQVLSFYAAEGERETAKKAKAKAEKAKAEAEKAKAEAEKAQLSWEAALEASMNSLNF